MSKTKFSDASPLDITAPAGGTVSGVGVLIGTIFGIAVTTNVAGDVVAIDTEGVFDHAKEASGARPGLGCRRRGLLGQRQQAPDQDRRRQHQGRQRHRCRPDHGCGRALPHRAVRLARRPSL